MSAKEILSYTDYGSHFHIDRLKEAGYPVSETRYYADALRSLQTKAYDLFVIDPLCSMNVGAEILTFDSLERRAPGLRLIRRLRQGEFLTPKSAHLISLSVTKNPDLLAELEKLGVTIIGLDSEHPISEFQKIVDALLK